VKINRFKYIVFVIITGDLLSYDYYISIEVSCLSFLYYH